jgi:cell surface protein SprA
MKKKNALILTGTMLGLWAMYAFTIPQQMQEKIFTVFYPEKTPSFAKSGLGWVAPKATIAQDTLDPLRERFDNTIGSQPANAIDLNDPSVIEKNVEYDPITGQYIVTEKIGDDFFRAPSYMTFDEYSKYKEKKQRDAYFDKLQGVSTGIKKKKSAFDIGDPIAKFDIKNSLVDRLFGGTNVDIRPQGNINLTFGFDYQKILNPILTRRQQSTGNFDFDMDINMGATGKIGEKLNLNFNYNTQATFDFDNQMKLNYDTKNFSEDEILQNIEAGNVSFPLRSSLIKGAQNLFGLKTEMKFGHLRLTTVASQQRSKQENLSVQGGAQVQTFEVPIDEYDENRHFFLTHYNRYRFEPSLKCLPTPQGLFKINRMEVWITNDQRKTENARDIVGLTDLGEPEKYDSLLVQGTPGFDTDVNGVGLPANGANDLYLRMSDELKDDSTLRNSDQVVRRLQTNYGLKQIRDFEKQRCRLLSPQEYSFHDQLGFVSINLNVQPDQMVAIAVEYMYNGKPYKIGEFTSDFPNGDTTSQKVLFTKMLKSTTANVNRPIWDLMMKNVYAIGTANLDPQEFKFDIYYEDPGKGQKRFLNGPTIPAALKSKPLLQIFRLDTLNLQNDPGPDGVFDFVPGLTINLRSGRVMFPVLEPFGSYLRQKFVEAAPGIDTAELNRTIIYSQLYDNTITRAREFQQLNRFTLKGSYKSASNAEISLGTFNLPQGSVRVSAGGRQLIEGQDYEVDYNIGKVKILNDAILQSGQNVNVSFEDNTLFGFQSRTMLGVRADYEINKDVSIGATFMNLFERPLTQKVNIGDDPINNKMYGLDFNISKDAPWITKFMDRLPLIETKAPSSITVQAEGALLDPGHARAINQGGNKGGIIYIDDFEGSSSGIPLANPANSWVLASVPTGDSTLAESALSNDIRGGANRARLTWYIADQGSADPVDVGNPYSRRIQFEELFPNRQLSPLEQSSLRPLDVTIYPNERGPYNYDIPDGYSGISQGLNAQGELKQPKTRWAGFMKGLNTNDFEAANIEFVEFWMLNPYMDKGDGSEISESGEMFIDLGSISEDVMHDSRQFFENAIPTNGTGGVATGAWGRVPVLPPVVNAFDNNPDKRSKQDVGFDGLDDAGERVYFQNTYLSKLGSLNAAVRTAIEEDPSNDNFKYYRDPSFEASTPGISARYKMFNNPERNSPVNTTSNQNPSSTNQPDIEDLNGDNSLNETEAFFRYRIPLKRDPMVNDLAVDDPEIRDLITDKKDTTINGQVFSYYRFKIPLDNKNIRQDIGGIQDFRSIRFVRVFFKQFTEKTTFRFATFELGRNQWRRFTQDISCEGQPPLTTLFDVNSVSIEENSARRPFNYCIPWGIQREQSVGAFPDILQNEQALSMNICDLNYCDGRGIYKTLNMDLRQFKRLQMFAHAEDANPINSAMDTSGAPLALFIRMGSDFSRNYYEYQIPLTFSDINNPIIMNGNPDSKEYREEVWRVANNIDFPLELLTDLKTIRNADPNVTRIGDPYFIYDPEKPHNMVTIVGNPNLGLIKGLMVGVKNVDSIGFDKQCLEVWINELRLNGFNEKGGYAALARIDMKLADIGNLSLSGNYGSIGWGSMEQKLQDRSREEVIQYDISTNLELGKLLPEKSKLKIPFYAQYSNLTKNPEYDPYDLDIKLKDKLANETDALKRDTIRNSAQDVTINKGYNFTNVRKERNAKAKPFPWNVSNFSVTYAYNNEVKRNPFVVRDDKKQYKGALDYTYTTGLKPITPFKKAIKKDKYLKFITDFNFNPIPNNYGFTTSLERLFNTTTWRFVDDPNNLERNTYFNKRFTWDRNYDLGWDISKGIKFNYDANARSLIDEPNEIQADGTRLPSNLRTQAIKTNLKKLGRNKTYQQNVGLTYTLPFKQIPMMDWVTVKASYTGGYTWNAASLKMPDLGNIIQNQSTRQINGDVNFETLYNKSKYLGKINKPVKSKDKKKGKNKDGGAGKDAPSDGSGDNKDSGRGADDSGKKDDGRSMDGGRGRMGDDGKKSDSKMPKDRRSADDKSGEDFKPMPVLGADGKPVIGPDGKPLMTTEDKASKADKSKKAKDKKKKDRQPSLAERIAIRPLMLIRKGRFTYSENVGSVIPGFMPETNLFGLDQGFKNPGWGYVAGVTPDDGYLDRAAQRNLISTSNELNQDATRTFTQNFDAGLTVEPFQDFRVELSANRQYTKNHSELFKDQNFLVTPNQVAFEHRAQRDMGSFTTSFFSLNTLFNNDIDGLFDRFKDNRAIVSNRLGVIANATDPHEVDGLPYSRGFGRIHQEVLIPSFLSAYREKDANTTDLSVFNTRPSVNWKLNYNGLSKVGNLSKIFSSVSISHGYKNTLTVNSFNTDLFYDSNNPYTTETLTGNYTARYEIPQVLINEQMQPLLGIDVKMKNDMTFKVDMKKSRNLAMSFIDYQLAETNSTGYTMGFGYRMKNVNIPFLTGKKAKKGSKSKSKLKKDDPKSGDKTATSGDKATGGGKKKPAGNDMNFKFDFDYRDDITVNHRLDLTAVAEPTRGSRTITISPSVDYALNKQLKLRLFCDYRKTVPKTSQSYPITNINAGVTVQFSLN